MVLYRGTRTTINRSPTYHNVSVHIRNTKRMRCTSVMTLHEIIAEENLTSSNLYRIFLYPFAIIPDGLGFGITHSMVTMMFEMSLQLVNPKIALPYWDFTIEGAVVDAQLDGDFTRLTEASDLWNEDWFGSVNQEDWQVKNGRWAYLEGPIIDQEHRDFPLCCQCRRLQLFVCFTSTRICLFR